MLDDPIKKKFRTRYATKAEAIADGWRSPNSDDRDVSGMAPDGAAYFGYEYETPDGRYSHTITLTETRNKIGQLGAYCEMIRRDPEDEK